MAINKNIINEVANLESIIGFEGHTKVAAYRLLEAGGKNSMHLSVSLDEIEPGGSTSPHYHTDCDPFDHAFYVISGDLVISIAGQEQKVDANTLVYCRSDQVHSMINVGPRKAKVLVISASAAGTDMPGRQVYLK